MRLATDFHCIRLHYLSGVTEGIPDETQQRLPTVVMWCDEQSVAGFIFFISIPQNSLLVP